MTTDVVTGQATRGLSDVVSEEIRAQLGRRRMSQAGLARILQVSPSWVSLRLSNKQPIDLDDLQRIAEALGVNAVSLLATRQYLSRGKDLPQAAAHRVPNMSRSRRPQRRHAERIAA